jgi:hypothetical protein
MSCTVSSVAFSGFQDLLRPLGFAAAPGFRARLHHLGHGLS